MLKMMVQIALVYLLVFLSSTVLAQTADDAIPSLDRDNLVPITNARLTPLDGIWWVDWDQELVFCRSVPFGTYYGQYSDAESRLRLSDDENVITYFLTNSRTVIQMGRQNDNTFYYGGVIYDIPNSGSGFDLLGMHFTVLSPTEIRGWQSLYMNPPSDCTLREIPFTATRIGGVDCDVVTSIPKSECEALIDFYNMTGGISWINTSKWLADDFPCYWHGVICGDPGHGQGHVIGLELPDNEIRYRGEEHSEDYAELLARFPYLERLNLADNEDDVSIPLHHLTPLTNLRYVNLANTNVVGGIPPEISQLNQLRELYLYGSGLTGTIPHELSNLSSLEVLQLHSNHLSGPIPNSLMWLGNLRQLHLHANRLSGTLPGDWSYLAGLQELRLHANDLSGELPPSLAHLTQITALSLEYNRFTADPNETALHAWLSSQNPNWIVTQTIPPEEVTATWDDDGVTINWTPIPYTQDAGYYTVRYGQQSGGPYETPGCVTNDKLATTCTIPDLVPEETLYFVVQTITQPHGDQQNTLVSAPSDEARLAGKTFRVLYTGDLYGRLRPWEDDEGIMRGGMANIAGLIAQQRELAEDVLVVDGGDTLLGTPLANDSSGGLMIEVMNTINYDAWTPGNHDFDHGSDNLAFHLQGANFTPIAANLWEGPAIWPAVTNFASWDVGGLQVAMMGLANPATPERTKPDAVTGLTFYDPVVTVANWLEVTGTWYDVHIVLSHLSHEDNLALVAAVPDIDIIIGSDDHTPLLTPIQIGQTTLLNPGEWGRYLGDALVTVAPNGNISVESTLHEIREGVTPRDDALHTYIEDNWQFLLNRLGTVLGQIGNDLLPIGEVAWTNSYEFPFGNLVTDAMLESVPVSGPPPEIAIFNNNSIRQAILAGDVTMLDLKQALPFENQLVYMTLTGEQLAAIVEETTFDKHPNKLSFAGLNYIFDPGQPAGARVTAITVGGEDMDRSRSYRVVTNDFLAGGGDQWSLFTQDQQLQERVLGTLAEDALAAYIRHYGTVWANIEGRIRRVDGWPFEPNILSMTENLTVYAQQHATLSVDVYGHPYLVYQWYERLPNGEDVPVGDDAPTYTTPPLNADATYWVRVMNVYGVRDSPLMSITVQPVDPADADMNGDGVISPLDVIYIVNRLNQPVGASNMRADINEDGQLTEADLELVLSVLGQDVP